MVTVKLTPEQFTAKSAELKTKLGITLAAPAADGSSQGTLAKEGVTVGYHYDGKATLTANIVSKPKLVPMGYAENKLRAWLTT